MGIDYHIAKFVKAELRPGARVLTIGRQNWWLTPQESKRLGLRWRPKYGRATYSEPFLKEVGAKSVDSVDIVNDESPTLVADLSKFWRPQDHWDAVMDFGTGEHIGDQSAYWWNIHRALDWCGVLMVALPANQMCGHGLYQYSPEFFTNMVGYKARVWVAEYGWSVKLREWKASGRFEIRNRYPTYIFAAMEKCGSFEMPRQNATATHCPEVPYAGLLLGLPLVRRLQRVLR